MAVTKYWDGAQWVPILAGPTGATGPTGPQGTPGAPGAAALDSLWSFDSTQSAPPASGEIRTNGFPATTIWIHELDDGGVDRSPELDAVTDGESKLWLRDNAGHFSVYLITAHVDNGTYETYTVTKQSGTDVDVNQNEVIYVDLVNPVALPADVVTYTGTVSKMHGPITQAAYDALSPPDADTWYIIVG